MAIQQVIIEGTLLGDPQETRDGRHYVHFRLLYEGVDGPLVLDCERWMGHGWDSQPRERVLVFGHLRKEGSGLRVRVVSMRRLLEERWPPVTPLSDLPDPVSDEEDIPF